MRTSIIIVAVCLTAIVPGCSRRKSHNERLQREWNAKVKAVADLLAGVTDVPSAKAAEPKLAAALEELERVDAELRKTYDPEDVDAVEREPMTEAVAQGLAEMQRETAETFRISKRPELVEALGETWKKIPSVFLLEAAGAIPKKK